MKIGAPLLQLLFTAAPTQPHDYVGQVFGSELRCGTANYAHAAMMLRGEIVQDNLLRCI